MTRNDTKAQLALIWEALHKGHEQALDTYKDSLHLISEDWDEICMAMAFISEDLGMAMCSSCGEIIEIESALCNQCETAENSRG